MADNVRVYHPGIEQFAVIPTSTLPIRERKGWVRVDDDAPAPSPEDEPSTPPSGGDNEPPNLGEE